MHFPFGINYIQLVKVAVIYKSLTLKYSKPIMSIIVLECKQTNCTGGVGLVCYRLNVIKL